MFKMKVLSRIFNLLPFAYLLFRFYLVGINETVQKVLLLLILLIYISFNIFSGKLKLTRPFRNSILVFAFVVLLVISTFIFHSFEDITYLRKVLSYSLDFLCVFSFIIHVNNSKSSDKLHILCTDYCLIVSLYVAFTIVCIVFPQVATFWKTIIVISEHDSYMLSGIIAKYVGRFSWNGFAGYGATYACSLGVFLASLQLTKLNKSKKKHNIIIFGLLCTICLIGNFFYGRTGLLVSGIIILSTIIVVTIKKKKTNILIGASFTLAITLAVLFALKNQIPIIDSVYNWAFEPIINALSGNGFTSDSTDSLLNMYKIPPVSSFLFGDGYYTDPVSGLYYQGTDVGFLRLIFYWGIFPSLFLYISIFYLFKKTALYQGKHSLFAFFVLFLLFEMKGEAALTILIFVSSTTLLKKDTSCQPFCFSKKQSSFQLAR